jgi:hypothetical protein
MKQRLSMKLVASVAGAAILWCMTTLPTMAGALRAGAAKVNITSSLEEFPYTAPRERPYVGIHDEVYARALVLDDGKQRAAIVMVEVTKLPDPESLVKSVAREINAPETNVIVAATHTHNVPLVFFHEDVPNALQSREIARLTQGAVQAVRDARAQLAPARVAFAGGQAWVNVNNGEQAGLKTGYDPQGSSDKTLAVVKVTKLDGSPLALLVNYATHAEVMFRSVTRDGGYEVSGDFPGAVSRLLEAQSEAAPIVLYTAAAEADQTTLFKSLQAAGRLPAADEGVAGWALLNIQARRLANVVMEIASAMPTGAQEAHIAAAVAQPVCPGQRVRRDPVSGEPSLEDAPPVAIPLSMIRVNDIVLAGVGGDVASDIGRQFKVASPSVHSALISMANGSLGYLLTDASYEHPGHGVMGSPVKSHCAAPAIVDGLVRLAKSGN